MSACPGPPYPLRFFPAIAAIPALMLLPGLAVITSTSTTTGAVHVLGCPGGTDTISLSVEAQPMPPVREEDPSDNLDQSTIRICLHD